MHVLYLTKDLFFSSRVSSLAREAGVSMQVSSSIDAFPIQDDTALVIIDLAVPQLDIARANCELRKSCRHLKIVAYGPHVDAATLAAAERAGCDLVLPRSQFGQQIAALLRELAASQR